MIADSAEQRPLHATFCARLTAGRTAAALVCSKTRRKPPRKLRLLTHPPARASCALRLRYSLLTYSHTATRNVQTPTPAVAPRHRDLLFALVASLCFSISIPFPSQSLARPQISSFSLREGRQCFCYWLVGHRYRIDTAVFAIATASVRFEAQPEAGILATPFRRRRSVPPALCGAGAQRSERGGPVAPVSSVRADYLCDGIDIEDEALRSYRGNAKVDGGAEAQRLGSCLKRPSDSSVNNPPHTYTTWIGRHSSSSASGGQIPAAANGSRGCTCTALADDDDEADISNEVPLSTPPLPGSPVSRR